MLNNADDTDVLRGVSVADEQSLKEKRELENHWAELMRMSQTATSTHGGNGWLRSTSMSMSMTSIGFKAGVDKSIVNDVSLELE